MEKLATLKMTAAIKAVKREVNRIVELTQSVTKMLAELAQLNPHDKHFTTFDDPEMKRISQYMVRLKQKLELKDAKLKKIPLSLPTIPPLPVFPTPEELTQEL